MSFSCKKKKIEKKSALAAKSARSAAKDAGSLVSEQAHDLSKQAAKYFGQAQDWAEPRVKDALDSGKDAYARARKETVKFAAPKIEAATEAVRPKVDHAYEAIADDYLPRIQKAMHDAAKAAQSTKGLDKKARKAGKAAQKALSKKPKSNTAAKTFGWVLVGTVAAGAGYLLWRRTQPIEDPWAEEYWNEAEGAKPVALHAKNDSQLADKVKDAVDNVKDGAKKAADAVGAKVEEIKDKVEKDSGKDVKVEAPAGGLGAKPVDEVKPSDLAKKDDGKLGEVREDLKDAGDNVKEAADNAKKAVDKKIDDLKK